MRLLVLPSKDLILACWDFDPVHSHHVRVDHESQCVPHVALVCVDGVFEQIIEVALASLEDA